MARGEYSLDGGSGHEYGIGLTGNLYEYHDFEFIGYAQVARKEDDYGKFSERFDGLFENASASSSGYEALVGILAAFSVGDSLQVFAAAETSPYSELELTFNSRWGQFDGLEIWNDHPETSKLNIEKAESVVIRTGFNYQLAALNIHGNVIFGDDKAGLFGFTLAY